MKRRFTRAWSTLAALALLAGMLPAAAFARVGTITKTDIRAGNYPVINVQPYQDYLYVTTNDAPVKGVKILKKNASGGYDDITPETVSIDAALEGDALEAAVAAGDLKGRVRGIDNFDTIALNGDILAVGFEWKYESDFDDSVHHTAVDEGGQDQSFCNGSGVRLYSLRNPERPKFLGCCYSGNTRGIEFYNNYMYVANEANGLQIMNTDSITKVELNLPEDIKAYSIRVFGGKLYVGGYKGNNIYDWENGYLLVYDISGGKAQSPELLVNRRMTRKDGNKSFIRSVAVNDNVVVTVDAPEGGIPVEVSLLANDAAALNSTEPLAVIRKTAQNDWDLGPGWTRYANIFNTDYLFVTCAGNGHFNIYDISDPQNPAGVYFTYSDIYYSTTLRSQGNKIYSGNANDGKKGTFAEFTIDSPDVFTGDMVFTSNGVVLNQPVPGKIDSSISVTNNTGAQKDLRLIAAYYENGALSEVKITNAVLAGKETRELSVSIDAPVLDADCYVKYMVWDAAVTPLATAKKAGAPEYTDNRLFDQYIDDVPSMDVLCAPQGQLTEETTPDGVRIKRFRFNSINVDGFGNKIYCVMAVPADASAENKVPAILQIHGGSGNAKETEQAIIENARQGYASLTFDCPAWCTMHEVTEAEYNAYPRDDKHIRDGKYYVGYDTNIGRWITEGESGNGYGPYEVKDGTVERNSTYGTVVAGMQAFNYLASQEFVDADKMGITGISMGGYLTTMLSSLLGDKVKAAYSIYGCGYYDKGSSFKYDVLNPNLNPNYQIWLDNLDAGRYAHRMTAPYFVAAAINDYFFYPEAVMATLNDIPNKNQAFSANSFHNLWNLPNADQYAKEIFKYYLKGEGNALPKVTVDSVRKQADGSLQITFTPTAGGALGIASAKLYYSPLKDKNGDDGKINTERIWTEVVPAPAGNGTYTAEIPAAQAEAGAEWTVIATDNRFGSDGMTGGSYVYNTKYTF